MKGPGACRDWKRRGTLLELAAGWQGLDASAQAFPDGDFEPSTWRAPAAIHRRGTMKESAGRICGSGAHRLAWRADGLDRRNGGQLRSFTADGRRHVLGILRSWFPPNANGA